MKVLFNSKFAKDISVINDQKLKSAIKDLIIQFENAESLEEISNLKKLKGYKTAYRIRMGDYRLGFFFVDNIIEIVRLVKRNDIYKVFP